MSTLVTASRTRGLALLALVAAVALFGGDHAALAEAAAEAVGEEAHGGGLPQFNASFFLTQLFWLTAIFGTFYLLIQGVAVPAVVRVLETRDGRIALDIGRAEELRNEAAAVTEVIEDKIIHARDHARTILALANREAETVAAARLAMFDAKIGGKVRDAERRIAHARENAMKELPQLAGVLVNDMVTRLGQADAEPMSVTEAVQSVIRDRVPA